MISPRSAGVPRRWPVLLALALLGAAPRRSTTVDEPPVISANDNLVPAGRLRAGTLTLTLEARTGRWYPDLDRRPEPLMVAAFGQPGNDPTIPGPLIRVRAGTSIRVRLVNHLADTLTVHGLHPHPATAGDPVSVPPGATTEVRFDAGAPGTYFYWASTGHRPITERRGPESQLSGALVVDPARGPVPADRIFLLGIYDLADPDAPPDAPFAPFAPAINGRSWPYTERMNLAVGDTVHWRWINPSADNHPMHLHGFYYRVDSRGTSLADTVYAPDQRREVVTERLSEGTTMTMTWSPERAGRWLMHCHLHFHVAPDSGWGPNRPVAHEGMTHGMDADGGMGDMAGLVLGIDVRALGQPTNAEPQVTRLVRLAVEPAVEAPRIAVALEEAGAVTRASTPGPTLVLTRGESAEITVVNGLAEPTAIHWHGIELDSYYDGVPGWSGSTARLAPLIPPGDSFVAHMTPPRAGTFIYHAHNLATKQVGNGLVGALLVLEPGEARNPDDEIIWIIGGNAIFFTGHLEVNGHRHPPPLTLAAHHRYRVRLINITEDNTGDVTLGDSSGLATWRPLAKDAMPLPPGQTQPVPASVRTSVGETYDYEFDAGEPRTLTLLVQNGGKPMASQMVEIR